MTLDAFRASRLYDFLMAVPLILWFGNGAVTLRPALVADGVALMAGRADLLVALQFPALVAALCFNLMLVYVLVVRERPKLRARGLLPRLCGFVGTFLGVGILHLPPVRLSLPWQILADLFILGGSGLSAMVLWRLGRAFSIMPEARVLVTDGPYAHARHPLYAVELLTIAGTALQFTQPWAFLLAVCVAALLGARSHYEEQVLAEAFPEYEDYRRSVKRFGFV